MWNLVKYTEAIIFSLIILNYNILLDLLYYSNITWGAWINPCYQSAIIMITSATTGDLKSNHRKQQWPTICYLVFYSILINSGFLISQYQLGT